MRSLASFERCLPPSAEIGRVAHWERSPSFTEVAGLLVPTTEVKPGQFLGVWHGRRGINALTVIQVANSFEVNPNEVPELGGAREARAEPRLRGRGRIDQDLQTRRVRNR